MPIVPQSTPRKQSAAAAATKIAATPKARAPVMGKAKEPYVYKPVMTNEDMERRR